MKMDCDDSYVFVPLTLANPAMRRYNSTEHRAQSTEHRAQSTEHRAQSTEHRAQSTEPYYSLIPSSKGHFFSSLSLSAPVGGAAFSRIADQETRYKRGGGFAAASDDTVAHSGIEFPSML
jgi:uncharacterized membrane protein